MSPTGPGFNLLREAIREMNNQMQIGVHTLDEPFYVSKWPSQEDTGGHTICLNLSLEKYGHPAMFPCQALKTKSWASEGPSLML